MLADCQVKPYLRTVVAEAIDRGLHRERRALDRFRRSFLVRRLSALVCSAGLSDPRVRPVGHALTMIPIKTDSGGS